MDWDALRPVVDAYARGRISWEQLAELGGQWLDGASDFTEALPMTQQARALRFVRAHPGCTAPELATALSIANATSTVAYLRDRGFVRTERAARGRLRIWVVG